MKNSFLIGKAAENRFLRCAMRRGYNVSKSTIEEDRHLHIDYWVSARGYGKYGVDVKGSNSPEEIWCEFVNVKGEPGWMYGESKIIAFDMPEEGGFCLVDTEDLKSYCEMNVEDEFVSAKDAYKKKYTRNGRGDIITKINLSDLKKIISYRVWAYDTEY